MIDQIHLELELSNINIVNDNHYTYLIERLNWNLNIFIINVYEVDDEYAKIYNMNICLKINSYIKKYLNIDIRKKGYKEKYMLMIKVDELLQELWN
jgi:hypothetical protein